MSYLALVAAQLLYSASDLWKKMIFSAQGFNLATLARPAFIATLVLAMIGFLVQLYAISKLDLSRMAVTIGMMAVIFSTAAGILVLKESFNVWNGLGIVAALLAIFLVHVK
ncbi:MAG: EamA family transporter [Patescibacteria group bacterium]|jgi:drug/metabolite transporter (DMT)-like permease